MPGMLQTMCGIQLELVNTHGEIPATIVDAKGDIIAATAADTVARLAVGANDTVLTADSSAATGLKWATPSSGGMTLLSTTTLSGTATTVSSISQSYKDLQIVISGVSASAGYRPKFYTAGTSSGNYATIMYPTNIVIGEYDFLGSATNFGTGTGNAIVINIYNYTGTTFKMATFGGASSQSSSTPFFAAGAIGTTSAISSITYTTTSGTPTFSGGTILIYGVK